MTGYRDRMQSGAHRVRLDGTDIVFGADGVCWSPPPHVEAVVGHPARASRFEVVQSLEKAAGEQLSGKAFVDAAVADQKAHETEKP